MGEEEVATPASVPPDGFDVAPVAIAGEQVHVEPGAVAEAEVPLESVYVGREDDVSVPPVDLDAGFFADTSALTDASFEVETRDPRAALKATPAAARRRAHLAKYVTAAVGVASALCIAALMKSSFAGGREEGRSQRSSFVGQAATTRPALNSTSATETTASPVLPANSAAVDPATAAPTADQAPPSTVPVAPDPASPVKTGAPGDQAVPAPTPSAGAPSQGAAMPSQAAVAAPAADPALNPAIAAKEAAKEKTRSRAALERGDMSAAIASGQRSVALDPTDAEAWLILGAAYQQKGDAKNAVRSFRACVSQGKRGPSSDCAAMLR